MRPRIALTMGDPAGVGPEVVAAALARDYDADVVVIGDRDRLRQAAEIVGHPITVPVVQVGELPPDLAFGKLDRDAGAASFGYLTAAVERAQRNEFDAIVTAPINKEAWHLADVPFTDHTEALAALTGSARHAMMLMTPDLRVILATTHLSMRAALDALTTEREREVIDLADKALEALGVAGRRIAVAGVNPHAGENGLLGSEEQVILTPAIDAARADGVDVTGPLPGDSVFMRARRGEFDVVVAQYHDQGLIPVKLLGLDDGISVVVGLPFIRTGVDHGTAYDIAGRGVASPASLERALTTAITLAEAMS